MDEIEVIALRDKKYYVLNRIELNDFTYIILLNISDETDLAVRKEVTKDDKKYLVMLNDEEELKLVLKEFAKLED